MHSLYIDNFVRLRQCFCINFRLQQISPWSTIFSQGNQNILRLDRLIIRCQPVYRISARILHPYPSLSALQLEQNYCLSEIDSVDTSDGIENAPGKWQLFSPRITIYSKNIISPTLCFWLTYLSNRGNYRHLWRKQWSQQDLTAHDVVYMSWQSRHLWLTSRLFRQPHIASTARVQWYTEASLEARQIMESMHWKCRRKKSPRPCFYWTHLSGARTWLAVFQVHIPLSFP